MSDTNEQSDVLGIRFKRDADDAPFMRFFETVQAEGMRQHGRVFFLDTCEGNDIVTEDVDCSDLSGWLIDPSDIEEFEPIWREGWTGLPERFDRDMVMARWSGDPSSPKIVFEFFNSRQ